MDLFCCYLRSRQVDKRKDAKKSRSPCVEASDTILLPCPTNSIMTLKTRPDWKCTNSGRWWRSIVPTIFSSSCAHFTSPSASRITRVSYQHVTRCAIVPGLDVLPSCINTDSCGRNVWIVRIFQDMVTRKDCAWMPKRVPDRKTASTAPSRRRSPCDVHLLTEVVIPKLGTDMNLSFLVGVPDLFRDRWPRVGRTTNVHVSAGSPWYL